MYLGDMTKKYRIKIFFFICLHLYEMDNGCKKTRLQYAELLYIQYCSYCTECKKGHVTGFFAYDSRGGGGNGHWTTTAKIMVFSSHVLGASANGGGGGMEPLPTTSKMSGFLYLTLLEF
jgi:hypothetical protein